MKILPKMPDKPTFLDFFKLRIHQHGESLPAEREQRDEDGHDRRRSFSRACATTWCTR